MRVPVMLIRKLDDSALFTENTYLEVGTSLGTNDHIWKKGILRGRRARSDSLLHTQPCYWHQHVDIVSSERYFGATIQLYLHPALHLALHCTALPFESRLPHHNHACARWRYVVL